MGLGKASLFPGGRRYPGGSRGGVRNPRKGSPGAGAGPDCRGRKGGSGGQEEEEKEEGASSPPGRPAPARGAGSGGRDSSSVARGL